MITEEMGRLRSKHSGYIKKLAKANEIIQHGLAVCSNPFVSCSFGKDSAVLLHMVMKHRSNIEARFIKWPESYLIYDFEKVIEAWIALGANVKILELTRESLNDKVRDRWLRLAAMNEADGSFVGLRADESKGRRMTLISNGTVFKNKNGFYRICPIAFFNTEDVAAYIYQHNLPTLNIYKQEGFQKRTSSRIPRNDFFIRQEMIQNLRLRDYSSFKKVLDMFPEIEEYV